VISTAIDLRRHHTVFQGLLFQHNKGCLEICQGSTQPGVKQGRNQRKLWICNYITLYLRNGTS